MTHWLEIVSVITLLLALASGIIILIDILTGHQQHMWIMNIVWTITALYSGPLGLWAYFKIGQLSADKNTRKAKENGKVSPAKRKPFWQSVMVGSSHCGGGCTLGDIIAEWFIYLVPFTLFGRGIFAGWALDYVLALLFGVAFQYFTIKPMRNLSVAEGLFEALKADFLSLSSWQIGMYGWMALVVFVIFGMGSQKQIQFSGS